MIRGKTKRQGPEGARSGARLRAASRFRRDRSGATAVEFAILAIPFLFILFATVETGLMFMGQLTLDGGVEQVARLVRTGQLDADQMKPEPFRKLICDKVKVFLSCDKLTIDLRSYDTFEGIDLSHPAAAEMNTTHTQTGAAKTIMALRVYYPWEPIADILSRMNATDGKVTLASVTAFRTEPY